MLRRILRSCFPHRPPLPPAVPSDSVRYCPIYKYSRNHHAWIGEWEVEPGDLRQVLPSKIALLVWNVSFSPPHRRQRLDCIIQYISEHVFAGQTPPPPCMILLQEVHHQALPLLLAHPFIRAHFSVSSISHLSWPQPCLLGNVTLVSKGIPVYANFTVEFPSTLTGRHVVFMDVQVTSYHLIRSFASDDATGIDLLGLSSRIRVGNVQLESLIDYGKRARPHQLHLLGEFLACPGLQGGLIGGDIGIMDDSEEEVPFAAGLTDAYKGPTGAGFTWGGQPSSEFGPKRFDRIYVSQECAIKVTSPRLVGENLRTELKNGESTWASEHSGLFAYLEITPAVQYKHSIRSNMT